MTLPDTPFGSQLRLLRLRARLTQAELGRAVGYSDAQISRLEQGRRPPALSVLRALFLPALGLAPESDEAQQLLALAVTARNHTRPDPPPVEREATQFTTADLTLIYAQLPVTAQILLARLSICPGPWPQTFALAVCDPDQCGDEGQQADCALLLRYGLMQDDPKADPASLRMTAQVHAFAQARLAERGSEQRQLAQRLRDNCLAVAEQARPAMSYGPELAPWMQRLAALETAFTVVLRDTLTTDAAVCGLRLASALRVFWYTGGQLREGRHWFEQLLALAAQADPPVPDQLYATALDDAALLAWRQGDYHQAEEWGSAALARYRSQANQAGEARVLMHLGLFAFDLGETARAQARYEASLPIYRALGNPPETIGVVHNLANLYNQLNASEQALPLYQECLSFYEQSGDQSGIALISLGLGTIYREQAEYLQAEAAFCRSLNLAQTVGDDWSVAVAELNLGDLALDQGDLVTARQRLATALTQFEQIGDQQHVSTTHGRLGEVELAAGHQAAALAHFRQGLLLAHAIVFQHGVASGLEGVAGCIASSQPLLAARLLGCAASIRVTTGVPLALTDQPRLARIMTQAQAHCSPSSWAAAWAEGEHLAPARAITLALTM
ncbi:MAG: tetratricopeptide repeat protein [Oscillochloridaceae bacterium umkhey_bin13]